MNILEILSLRPGTPIKGLDVSKTHNRGSYLCLDGWKHKGKELTKEEEIDEEQLFCIFKTRSMERFIKIKGLVSYNLSYDSSEILKSKIKSYEQCLVDNYRAMILTDGIGRNNGSFRIEHSLFAIRPHDILGLVLGPIILTRYGKNYIGIAMKILMPEDIVWIYLESDSEYAPMILN